MTTAQMIQNKLSRNGKRDPKRNNEIVEKYATIPNATFRSLATEYGLSVPRVQQIVHAGLAKILREGVLPE